MGAFTFGMQSTYVNKYEYQDYENGPWNLKVNRFSGEGVIFKWTHNATVNWNKGAYSAGLSGHYKSGYVDQNTTSEFPGNVVGSYATYDAYLAWSVTKKISITYGIRNLFDKAPPLSNQVYTFQAGYDPRYTDPIGRTQYLRGNVTF
jgi:iron complex outermembrane receptor protein